jgi:hypothetical protein
MVEDIAEDAQARAAVACACFHHGFDPAAVLA